MKPLRRETDLTAAGYRTIASTLSNSSTGVVERRTGVDVDTDEPGVV